MGVTNYAYAASWLSGLREIIDVASEHLHIRLPTNHSDGLETASLSISTVTGLFLLARKRELSPRRYLHSGVIYTSVTVIKV